MQWAAKTCRRYFFWSSFCIKSNCSLSTVIHFHIHCTIYHCDKHFINFPCFGILTQNQLCFFFPFCVRTSEITNVHSLINEATLLIGVLSDKPIHDIFANKLILFLALMTPNYLIISIFLEWFKDSALDKNRILIDNWYSSNNVDEEEVFYQLCYKTTLSCCRVRNFLSSKFIIVIIKPFVATSNNFSISVWNTCFVLLCYCHVV